MELVLEIIDDIKHLLKDQQYIDLMNELSKVHSATDDADATDAVNELTFGVMKLSDHYGFGLTMLWHDITGAIHNTYGPAEVKVYHSGAIRSYTWKTHGLVHREDDLPARMFYYQDGNIERLEWFLDGRQHRDRGPAVIVFDTNDNVSCLEWRSSNLLHRTDGPALTSIHDGYIEVEEWYNRGLLHRDGDPQTGDSRPAVINYKDNKVVAKAFYRYGEYIDRWVPHGT